MLEVIVVMCTFANYWSVDLNCATYSVRTEYCATTAADIIDHNAGFVKSVECIAPPEKPVPIRRHPARFIG
jgi:hypothetical protein